MRKRTLLVILLAGTVVGRWGCGGPESHPEQLPVGRSLVEFFDQDRPAWVGEGPRPVVATLWYPAPEGTRGERWGAGPFHFGVSAPGAPLRDGGPLPLVVMSHGTGGSAAQMAWLGETLASRGYLVAALNHHGNTAFEGDLLPEGFALWWERAADVPILLNGLLAHDRFGPRVDRERIGMVGFSLGGLTALLASGARVDRPGWERHCEGNSHHPACRLPPEAGELDQVMDRLLERPWAKASLDGAGASYRDDRIRAVYLLAPALAVAIDGGSLAEVAVPVRLVVGDADDQVPAQEVLTLLAGRIPGAESEVPEGVGHYTFLATCGLRGRLLVGALCRDKRGVRRHEVHRHVSDDVDAFFHRALNLTRLTTTEGTSRSSFSTHAANPPGPKARGRESVMMKLITATG